MNNRKKYTVNTDDENITNGEKQNNNNSSILMMQNNNNNNILPPRIVTKKDILKEMPFLARYLLNIMLLLEPPNNMKRIMLKYFITIVTIFIGIGGAIGLHEFEIKNNNNSSSNDGGATITNNNNATTTTTSTIIRPNFTSFSFAYFFCFTLVWPLTNYYVYFYFENNSIKSEFLNAYTRLPLKKKQKAYTILKYFFGIWVFYFLFALSLEIFITIPIISNYQSNALMMYKIIHIILYLYHFSFGSINCCCCLIFIVTVMNSFQANEIYLQLEEKMIQSILKYTMIASLEVGDNDNNNINNNDEVLDITLKRKHAKILINQLQNKLNTLSENMKFTVNTLGNMIALWNITFVITIVFRILDPLNVSLQGKSVPIAEVISIIVLVASLSVPLQLYLTLTMVPSLAFTKFINKLHEPSILLILSECYIKNHSALQLFFDGLQIKRNDLIWKYFGIGVTFQLYRNIFSALGSLITICAYI